MTKFEAVAAAFPLHVQRIVECSYTSASVYCPSRSGAEFDRVVTIAWTDPSEGVSNDMAGSFFFEETPEGFDYWNALWLAGRELAL